MNTNTTGADRTEFEAWAKSEGYSLRLYEFTDNYYDAETAGAWRGWKGAKQTATNPEPRKTLLTEGAIEAGANALMFAGSDETNALLAERIFHAMEAQLPSFVPATPAAQTDDLAFQYASSLATALFQTHFATDPDYTSGRVKWGLCDSTAGILTQIDNMVSGLVKPPAQTQEPAGWLHTMHMAGEQKQKKTNRPAY